MTRRGFRVCDIRWLVGGMALFELGVAGCDSECEDPFPAACVEAYNPDGSAAQPDLIQFVQDGVTVDTIVPSGACEPMGLCCTWSVQTGLTTVIVERGEEVLEQQVEITNSNACDHEVATPAFTFTQTP